MVGATPYWQRVLILVPVFIIGGGLMLGVFVLLGRALAQSIRESGHKGLILAGLGLFVVAVVILTYLGVNLPRE